MSYPYETNKKVKINKITIILNSLRLAAALICSKRVLTVAEQTNKKNKKEEGIL